MQLLGYMRPMMDSSVMAVCWAATAIPYLSTDTLSISYHVPEKLYRSSHSYCKYMHSFLIYLG